MVPTVEKIGRYEIVSELGRGAMGLVYRAVDPNIGRTVALKTMRLDVHGMDHDEMLRRFRNEARTAGLMSHANIVTIYDADEVDGLFYIAMEYVEGQTIQSMVVEKRIIPADQIVAIAKQVCLGLDYAHHRKVIHRDIKPANIMITPNHVAKIMDFGISKSVGSMTSSGQVLGTPNYMAPEQVKGLDLDGRADLFSFGVVLYEMATGERPFSGQNVTTIIYKIVNETPIAPCELEATVHPGLSTVILRCLAKNPEERYQTGAHLVRDLENYRSIGSEGDATSVLPVQAPLASASLSRRPVSLQVDAMSQSGAAVAVASAKAAPTLRQTIPVQPARSGDWSAEKIIALVAIVVFASILSAGAIYKFRHRHHPAAVIPLLPQTVVQATGQATSAPMAPGPLVSAPAESPSQPTTDDIKAVVPNEAKPQTADAARVADNSKPVIEKKSPSAPATGEKAKGKVEVRFSSDPEGAFVQFDGRSSEAWMTPFTMSDVKPGTHEAVFTKQGYQPETRTLEIGSKSAPYNISLVPVTTAIFVTSTPAGASIEVDGRDSGKVTPAQIPVAEGQHKIVVRLDGFRWAQTTTNVTRGQVASFQPMLNPSDAPQAGNTNPVTTRLKKLLGANAGKGMIDFVSDPAGARIFIQGRPTRFATPAHAPFPPGDYVIELREPGYKPAQRRVHVDAGEVYKLNIPLEPK